MKVEAYLKMRLGYARRALGGNVKAGVWLALLVGCGGSEEVTETLPDPAAEEPAASKAAPNVLFIVWDTVRADHLSLYGYPKSTSPRLEAFASGAVVYERATSPGMWTLPAHASMFTGLPGTSHGANAKHRWLDHHHDTLAELLGQAGYDTFGISTNLIASPMSNLAQGFDVFETTYPRGTKGRVGKYSRAAKQATMSKILADDASTEMSPKFGGNGGDKWAKAVYKDAGPVLHQALGDFLGAREGDRPWFAYLNMMEAHTPRVPSLAARKKVMDADRLALGLATDASLFASNAYIVGKNTYTNEELAAINGIYDAALIDVDEATGAMLDDLGDRGLLDNTLVIIVSDHGESLGEHQLLEHRWSMYDGLLHVPLVVRYPGQSTGERVEERVSTIDLFATVLDVTGTEIPANPAIRSKTLRGRVFDDVVFSEMRDPFASMMKNVHQAWPDHDLTPWLQTYDVAYKGEHKLLRTCDGTARVFDIGADPLENHPLEDVERAEALGKAFDDWHGALAPYDPARRGPREGARQQVDEDRAMLVALGYTQDEGEIDAHPCAMKPRVPSGASQGVTGEKTQVDAVEQARSSEPGGE
jgi:arylsulfatase A-like enzyme